MKKTKAGFAMLLSFFVAGGPAGAAVQTHGALTRIAVAGAVSGEVMALAIQPGAVGREMSTGKPIYLNDKITTGPGGRLQVMLLDETVFTIGPNAAMMLDEYHYDPKSGAGKVSAQIIKGSFKFITGNIGHNNPANMSVKFPTATMGVRGTIVSGFVAPDGAVTAVLLGPGPATKIAGERVGAFTLSNAAGSVDVNRAGYSTTVAALNSKPSAPVIASLAILAKIQTHLTANNKEISPADKKESSAVPVKPGAAYAGTLKSDAPAAKSGGTAPLHFIPALPGAHVATGKPVSGGLAKGVLPALPSHVPSPTGDLSTLPNTHLITGLPTFVPPPVADHAIRRTGPTLRPGPATMVDLRAIPTGTGVYAGGGSFSYPAGGGVLAGTGQFSFHFNVDFAHKTFGGGGSALSISGTQLAPAATTINAINYSLLTGAAAFTLSAVANNSTNAAFDGTTISVFNSATKAAAGVLVGLRYKLPGGATTPTATGTGQGRR